ncbi:unnamed protein product [Owenia fusiformis]|uniref:GDP-fucose pyrophosphorylase domain-containing protein n=1 Tax=Owenia fusiformis TaxID=6347 RepID=A0A8J1TEQ4_OWEFU|nr:unnamed protein product [Owenia fusiformis]
MKIAETRMEDKMENIATKTAQLIEKFNAIRGKSVKEIDIPFWDVVVITASDDAQREAFQLQVFDKLQRKEIPSDVPYHVIADPEGPKIGSGGSTFHVLEELENMYGDILSTLKIILIHAGGQSQRLPNASVMGKIFTALPLGDPMYQIIDLKLMLYLDLIPRMGPGVFLAAGDTIELFDLGDDDDNWQFSNEGFTALAHPSSLRIGTGHGVYVVEQKPRDSAKILETVECLEVLQKPSIDTMHARGAVMQGPDQQPFVYSDSAFFFTHDVVKTLIDFYRANKPIQCEIEAYGDFLCALGPRATIDYTNCTANAVTVPESLVPTRQKVFHALKGLPLTVIAMNVSRFYHIGTTKEYINHFCSDQVFSKELGLSNNVFSSAFNASSTISNGTPSTLTNYDVKEGSNKVKTGCVMHSSYVKGSFIPALTVVEFCNFETPVKIGENSIISNCEYLSMNTQTVECLNIPGNVFLHTVPVSHKDGASYVTVMFGTNDNVKKKVDRAKVGELSLLVMNLEKYLKLLGIDLDVVVGDQQTEISLWTLKLFPVVTTMTSSLATSLSMLKVLNGEMSECTILKDVTVWLSMKDILRTKDVNTMLKYRNKLYKKIKQSLTY